MPRPKNPAKKPLTMKERKLVAEYVKTGNKKQSAIAAGYSPKSAPQIADATFKKENVQAAVKSAAEKLGINHEYVLGNFKEIADFNKQTRVKARQVNGEIFHEEEMIDAQASLKANEMLGKHLKLFIDTVEVTGKDGKDLIPADEKKKSLARQIAFLMASAKKGTN